MARAKLAASALTLFLLSCLTVPSDVQAGASAQLRVTARVVNQCTVRLPDRVPARVAARLEDVRKHVDHRCAFPIPAHVGALSGRFRSALDRNGPVRIERTRARPDAILVTITY